MGGNPFGRVLAGWGANPVSSTRTCPAALPRFDIAAWAQLLRTRIPGYRPPRTVRCSLPAARLPLAIDSLSVLLISDLHVCGRSHPALTALDGLAGARTDLLIAAGDLVESERFVADVGERLARIEARLGSFAVWGNHDALGTPQRRGPRWLRHETRSLPNLQAGLAEHGIQTLTNRAVRIFVNGAPLQLLGVGDTHVGLCDLKAAFDGVDPDIFTILAAHNPDTAFELGRRRVDLTLSGHTHGGQISLPFFGPLTLRIRNRLPRPCGLMYVKGRPLVVSAGVGTAGVPVRFNAPADVVDLRLIRVRSP